LNILSVVIPVLNEEDSVAEIMDRVLSIEEPLKKVKVEELELIIVDDGSTDSTADIVAGYKDKGVVLIKHPVNQGYGAAIKTGFRNAKGNLLAFLDADGTYPPESYPELCEPIIERGADLVIGSRMTGNETGMPLVRRIGNTIFATLVSIVSNNRVSDSASGQRVLRRDALEHLYPLPDGLNFTPVMSTRAMYEDINVVEVPIVYSERAGRSKLSVVRDGFRFLNTIMMTALTYNPARIFGLVGLLLVDLGFVTSLGLWLTREKTNRDARYAAGFAGIAATSAGINIFATGTAFNYVVSLFHGRQIRQGAFGTPIFNKPVERAFGWLGIATVAGGKLLYLISAINGWLNPKNKRVPSWFMPSVSTLMVLTGLNLILTWLLDTVLGELSERQEKAEIDLGRN